MFIHMFMYVCVNTHFGEDSEFRFWGMTLTVASQAELPTVQHQQSAQIASDLSAL